MKRLIYVAYFVEVGLLLLLVPWSAFWDRNYFVERFPVIVHAVAANNFVRGAVSGLGFINLCAAVTEFSAFMVPRRGRPRSSFDPEPQGNGGLQGEG